MANTDKLLSGTIVNVHYLILYSLRNNNRIIQVFCLKFIVEDC